MNKKTLQIAVIGCFALTLQACSIPMLLSKKADVPLPAEYSAVPSDQENVANVDWNTFFEDKNLVKLIETGLANNKEIRVMLERINIAENEIQARRGEYLPFVNIGGSAEAGKVGEYTRNGAVEEQLEIKEGKSFPRVLGNYQLGLNASWELDIWKKLRNATQVATFEYMATVEGQHFLMTNLVAEIARSYYELVTLDNQLENLEQNIKLQQEGLEAVKQLQKYARTNALAVKRYEAEVSKNQSKQFLLKQQITETENRINLLLGRNPQPILRTSASFMQMEPKVLHSGIPSDLLHNRPDIRKAELEMKANALNIDVAKAEFYPSFTIKAGLGFEAFKPQYLLNTPESLAFSLAGDIMAPLINRNAIIANYKNANAKQIQSAYEYEQTILRAYTEVINQISNMEKLEQSYQLKQHQVDKLTESVNVANQLFKAARADYLEVLLTQRDTLEAKAELIENKQKQMLAMIDLYRALGGGWQSSDIKSQTEATH